MRGATSDEAKRDNAVSISTHAPHARRDITLGRTFPAHRFQLTRLMRGATIGKYEWELAGQFQLTRLMRGATGQFAIAADNFAFQLTRLMRGATAISCVKSRLHPNIRRTLTVNKVYPLHCVENPLYLHNIFRRTSLDFSNNQRFAFVRKPAQGAKRPVTV